MIEMRSKLPFCSVRPLVQLLVSHDANGVINGTIAFLGQDDQYEVQHDLSCDVIGIT